MSYKQTSPKPIIEGGTGVSTLPSNQILLGNGTSGIISTSNATINTSTGAIVLNSGTGSINIGTDAAAKTITVGNTTGGTAVALNTGTGNYSITSASGTLVNLLSTGPMIRPLQPAFMGYLVTTTAGVTGNGLLYTLGAGGALTIAYDQNSNFTTSGVFTAPVTGKYLFNAVIELGSISAGMSASSYVEVLANSIEYLSYYNPFALMTTSNTATVTVTALANMTAASTAIVRIQISGGVGNTATVVGSSSPVSYFTGYLVC